MKKPPAKGALNPYKLTGFYLAFWVVLPSGRRIYRDHHWDALPP